MEGARANHTLTKYDIVAYEIELTDLGLSSVSALQMSSDEKLIYVTPEEIATGQKEDKKLFVNAWTEQIGGKKLQNCWQTLLSPIRSLLNSLNFRYSSLQWTEFKREFLVENACRSGTW